MRQCTCLSLNHCRLVRKIRSTVTNLPPSVRLRHEPGGLLKRIGGIEHARLVQRPADNLKPERKPLRIQRAGHRHRSEEHTSELQSLMRTSYAVFCLKKKKTATSHQ